MLGSVPTFVPDITAWLALLATFAAVLGGIAGLWRWTTHQFTKSVGVIVAAQVGPINEQLPPIKERLDEVEAQLRPNGGASLRDQTNRIEDGVTAAAATAVEVKNRLES